jgi:hypothetical protein
LAAEKETASSIGANQLFTDGSHRVFGE